MAAIEMKNLSDTELLVMLCGAAGRALAKQSLPELFGFGKPRQEYLFAGEERASYMAHPQIAVAKELYIRAIQADMQETGINMTSPSSVRSFLCGRIGGLDYEAFWCLWLDSQNRLICADEMFRGTLTQTSVYPREVVKRALEVGSASVIIAHNHPSGATEASSADRMLTSTLKQTLALVDVRLLDHFIVARNQVTSFAEQGLI